VTVPEELKSVAWMQEKIAAADYSVVALSTPDGFKRQIQSVQRTTASCVDDARRTFQFQKVTDPLRVQRPQVSKIHR
jgi:hypothetical protein